LTLLWVNLHGGFMLIFALLGVEIAAELWEGLAAWRRPARLAVLAPVLVLCVLAAFVNPNGFDGLRYAFLLLGHEQMLNDIIEWWSPDFHDVWNQPLRAMLIVLTFSLAAARGCAARDVLLLAGLVHSALYSNRHTPLLAIACAPIMAEQLSQSAQGLRDWMAARRWSYPAWRTAAALAVAIFLFARVTVHARELPSGNWFQYCSEMRAFPVRACDFLASRPGSGRLYNAYHWGGYCIWRLWPRYRVFIDGRAEVYFDSGYVDYHSIERGKRGWETILRRRQVDTVLVPPESHLARYLATQREWRLVFQDAQAVVFTLAAPRAAGEPSPAQRTLERPGA
jgi:hypothetical protein